MRLIRCDRCRAEIPENRHGSLAYAEFGLNKGDSPTRVDLCNLCLSSLKGWAEPLPQPAGPHAE